MSPTYSKQSAEATFGTGEGANFAEAWSTGNFRKLDLRGR